MKHINHISVDTIISKLIRDLGLESINEDDIVEWSAEALQGIGTVDLLEEAVAFIEVKNHQIELPKRIDSIIQIARKNTWVRGDDSCSPCSIINEINTTCPVEPGLAVSGTCNIDDVIPSDCDGTPILETSLIYYRPYFDWSGPFFNWRHSKFFANQWSPVRLKNHSFFASIVCDEEQGLYDTCDSEYSIVGNKIVRFSFQEGFVAVAYTRQLLDENGYPMIPDTYSAITAVTKYITYKLMERNFYNNRQGSESRLQKSEADWHWYCKQATNEALLKGGVDLFENMLQARNYILPRNHRYNQFFSKMSKPESRRFLNPDNR